MKAPLSWIKEYVDVNCSAEDLKNKLFSCGFEVEDMIYVGKNIDKIVTCKILEIEKHPNADKLSVTKVDAGKYGKLQIITNAKNIAVGDVVPVAVDGATLNNGERIFKGELRGIPSDGMFCSGEELGINDDWYKGASVNGILILDKNFPLGEEVKKLLGIEDVVFDINVTANRPDCQSILGLAREVACVLNKPLKMPSLDFEVDKNISTKKSISIKDNAFDLCPRYIGHLVKDIKIAESPLWLKRRLFSMGLRSINNIVDITNYVLLEIGQPMHAFDLSTLSGNSIVIRRAVENEEIITLDEKKFNLNENNLVICDNLKPVAIAGVMGGLNSEIKDTTTDVVFESAKFARDNIRKTSRAIGQRTDASSRYEKGVDFYSPEIGIKRALNLITKLNCGKIACDEYDLFECKPERKIIKTTISKINEVLGIDVPAETIKDILTRLSFDVNIKNDDIQVTVPLYREDVESYPDIAEEVIREYGYDKLVPTLLKTSKITNGGRNIEQRNLDNLKDLLVGFGFNEIITYSFVSEKDYEIFNYDKNNIEHQFIKILNPLSEDVAIMRTTLLPSMLKVVANNINRKNFEGRLFEIAKVYHPKSLPLTELANEENFLSFACFGDNENFFTAKGVVEGIFNAFVPNEDIEYVSCDLGVMHPTRSAFIKVNGEMVGYFGQINPEVLNKIDVDKAIYAGEIFYDKLSKYFTSKIVFKPISKFPIIERDLAIVVDKDVTCGSVIKSIKENAGEFLDKVSLFDVYEGGQIADNKKSLAFNLIYVCLDRTLNVDEVELSIRNVLKALKDNLNAELR